MLASAVETRNWLNPNAEQFHLTRIFEPLAGADLWEHFLASLAPPNNDLKQKWRSNWISTFSLWRGEDLNL
ncbi:hypothetical protein CQ011_04555 [Arthrobacter sp. MYb213]|nr:hypothetical protein CQ011_04555 [Arthrobacter sp. MYb213]